MRFVSFSQYDRFPRVGVVVGSVVIDISAAAPLVFEDTDVVRWELLDVLRGAPDGMGVDGAAEIAAAVLDQIGVESADELAEADDSLLNQIVAGLTIGGASMVMPLDEIKLLAPLPRPNSVRLFDGFEQHAAAVARLVGRSLVPEWYDRPAFTFGNHSEIYGPNADVPMPRAAQLDYELAIGCVIGRAGRDILEEDAAAYIAGFTIVNDWSARETQREETAIGLGIAKSKDFATSLGPALVTLEEFEHLELGDGRYNMTMTAWVNNEQRSRGNFRDIHHTFAQMIAQASRDANLYPGDVLSSGAVGTGSLFSSTGGDGPWLEAGDLVELEISGLGVLRNRIV